MTRFDRDPNLNRLVWFYSLGSTSFQLTFQDITFSNRWVPSSSAGRVLEQAKRENPVVFLDRAVVSKFSLHVAHSGFLRTADESLLETSIGILPGEPGQPLPDRVRVTWAFFDRAERRIDHGEVVLTTEHARHQLLEPLPAAAVAKGAPNALVTRLPARLPGGAYRLAVEATDPSNGGHRWAVSEIQLGTRSKDTLQLSDLQLAASYAPLETGTVVDPTLVKHAQVIVPAPERAVGAEQADLFVYYEVYGLSADDAGLTRFNVSYDIDPRSPNVADPQEASVFLEERTGRSGVGTVVKGTKLDVASLPGGPHVLRVVITDLLTGGEVTRDLEFEVAPRGIN